MLAVGRPILAAAASQAAKPAKSRLGVLQKDAVIRVGCQWLAGCRIDYNAGSLNLIQHHLGASSTQRVTLAQEQFFILGEDGRGNVQANGFGQSQLQD